ncbi:MAG: prephenate dehydratase, partial [Gemmatimonadota bacterium]|nr:prephenate dehydratase [Gemmatimonadota bacterium]
MRVAIQGTRGSYSEAAARLHWPALEIVACRDVADVVSAVRDDRADGGCLAIENSLVGSVTPTYDLMQVAFGDGALRLGREVRLPVHHSILGVPGASLDQVTRILSHPVALGQCRTWLGRTLPNASLVSAWDTAGGAEIVAREGDPTQAAICGAQAAAIYGLSVFEERIEDDPTNQTRFLTFSSATLPVDHPEGAPLKTSLIVWTDHRPGMLAAVLQAFAGRGVNLTSLQSRPEQSATWTYRFYMDVEGSKDDPRLGEALESIEALASRIVVLGSYAAWQGEGAMVAAAVLPLPHHRPKPDLPLFDRRQHPEGTRVQVGPVTIGGDEPVLIAGPCSVESEEMIIATAEGVAAAGADMLRGGAFKPRTSPYDFQGLGARGLKYLAEARERTGLPVVTEVMSWEEVPLVAR